MFVLFLLLWIVFNGRVTVEIMIFGIVISAAMYWFICRFMGFSPKKELSYIKKGAYLLEYLFCLIREIVIANFATIRLTLTSNYEIEPVLVQFEVPLKSDTSKFLLANSITLTPGTITVAIEDNRFTVHCLDKTLAEGIEASIFVKLLCRLEEIQEINQGEV